MEPMDLMYHLDNLRECDPNYVVDVLNITSEELVNDYLDRAIEFIKEDQGE